jgi:hypothetical protein
VLGKGGCHTFEASASDPMIVSAATKLNCVSKTFVGAVWRTKFESD